MDAQPYVKIGISEEFSVESMVGIGMDGPSYEDPRTYAGLGAKGVYEFARNDKLNFYGYILSWLLADGSEPLSDAERFLGWGTGVGAEAWNGCSIQVGYVKMDYISSSTIGASKHYYF